MLIALIITAILQTLAGISYPYIEPRWKATISKDDCFQLSLGLNKL
jgi:hypothetical protein